MIIDIGRNVGPQFQVVNTTPKSSKNNETIVFLFQIDEKNSIEPIVAKHGYRSTSDNTRFKG